MQRKPSVRTIAFATRSAFTVLTFALLQTSCGRSDVDEDVSSVRSALATGPFTFSLPLLPHSSPAEYPVAAFSSLKIDANASIVSSSFLVQAFSSGAGPTSVDVAAKLGTVISQGPVDLRDRVQINGEVDSAGRVTTGVGATVSGGIVQQTPVGPFTNVTFAADFSGTPPPDTNVSSGSKTLNPGHFGGLHVFGGATVVLNPGTYVFTKLTFESNSVLALGAGTAPVIIYVADTMIYRGAIQGTNSEKRLLVAVAGTTPLFLETTFHGTLVAPNAPLSIGQSNVPQFGGFFGLSVEVSSGVVLTHVPFDWVSFLPPTKNAWKDAPVVLVGSVNAAGTFNDGVANPPAAVSFNIPGAIKVRQGNAANGTATLSFVNGSGTTVTCQYKGGSTEPTPMPETSLVNWALGLSYKLVSCSNGLTAGAAATGRSFRLHVASGETLGQKVVASVQLGGGCTATLDDPFDPVVSAQTSTGFSWSSTQPLPETDPAGHPSLYYAWIYLENKDQIHGLNVMKVDWSMQPIFAVDLDKYKGQCGTIEYSGDGRGIFAYAIIPGTLYNFLRSAGLDAIANHKVMPFRAIIIPNKPNLGDATLWNADGSLSWDTLKRNQFQYFNGPQGGLRERQLGWFGSKIFHAVTHAVGSLVNEGAQVVGDILDGANDVATDVGGILSGDPTVLFSYSDKLSNLWTKGAQLIDKVGTAVTSFFGSVDKFVFGSVNATIDFDVISPDPMFNARMTRGWGARAGSEVAPTGATVYVKQWSLSIFGIFPVSFNGDINADGVVSMSIGKHNSSRGASGVCLTLENSNGMISPFLTASEICDFGNNATPSSDADSSEVISVTDSRASMLTQVTDGAQYDQQVLGHTPKEVEIGTGIAGNAVTSIATNGNPVTLCLGYPSAQHFILSTLVNVLGGPIVGTLTSAVLNKDIFMPDNDDPNTTAAKNSRGVTTHEYGHFTMCSLTVADNPSALSYLINRIGDGTADTRDDRIAVSFESFADLFASQVAGGTNYVVPSTAGFSASNNNNMEYCVGTPCVERNFRGIGEADTREFNDEVARTMTTFVDAFDGPGRARTDNNPGNGDIWMVPPPPALTPLVLSPAKYLPVGNVDDETISLPGAGWKTWIDRWVARSSVISIDHFMPALTDTMKIHNPSATACDLCDVYALHSPDTRAATATTRSAADRAIRQDICRVQADIHGWLADNAVPAEPINALTCASCLLGQVSVKGVCTNCGANDVVQANQCVTCSPGSFPSADRKTCIFCGTKQVIIANKCVDCPPDQGADVNTNTCVNCPGDVVIDWRTEVPLCRSQTFRSDQAPAPNDVCPTEFWVELDHVQSLLNPALQGPISPSGIFTTGASTNDRSVTKAVCDTILAQMDPWVPDPNHPGRFLPEGRIASPAGLSPLFGCTATAERDWLATDLQSHPVVDTLRFMLSRDKLTVNGASTTVPQQITVTEFCSTDGN